jgi:hypothetical protein
VDIRNYADNLAPFVVGGDTNAFADGILRGVPIFASEVFGDDDLRNALIRF